MKHYRTTNHAHGATDMIAKMPCALKLMNSGRYLTSSIISKAKALHSYLLNSDVPNVFSSFEALEETMNDLFILLDSADVVACVKEYTPAATPTPATQPAKREDEYENLPI